MSKLILEKTAMSFSQADLQKAIGFYLQHNILPGVTVTKVELSPNKQLGLNEYLHVVVMFDVEAQTRPTEGDHTIALNPVY